MEKFLEQIKNYYLQEQKDFSVKAEKLTSMYLQKIIDTFYEELKKSSDTFTKDTLTDIVKEISKEFKENLDNIEQDSINKIKEAIRKEVAINQEYLEANKDTLESKTNLSIQQITNLEGTISKQLKELLDFSINAINSAEKTSLFNLGKFQTETNERFLELKNQYELFINEKKELINNSIEEKKNDIERQLNVFLNNSKLSLEDSKNDLISRFDGFIEDAKQQLEQKKTELSNQLDARKQELIGSIEYDKQAVFNELNKRKDAILTEISQRRHLETVNIENKANSIFQEITRVLTGYDQEFEEFKRNKIAEFNAHVITVYNEYKKAVKLLSTNLTTTFNENHQNKMNSMEAKYLEYLQEMLNSFMLHVQALNEKKKEIVDYVGDNDTQGLWNRLKTDLTSHTDSKLLELIEKKNDSEHSIEALSVIKKQEINTLRNDVISNIGTENTSLYNGQSSIRKSAVDAINAVKDNVLDNIEEKRNQSIQSLTEEKQNLQENLVNEGTENIKRFIAEIKPQKFYGILPANTQTINLPNYFYTRKEMQVFLDGQLLTIDIHYEYIEESKQIKFKRTFDKDKEVFVYEQFPIGKGYAAEFIWRGTELGVRPQGENEYIYTDFASLIPHISQPENLPPLIKEVEPVGDNQFKIIFGDNKNVIITIPSIKGERGPVGPPGPRGADGAQGLDGARGPEGRVPTISTQDGFLTLDGEKVGTSLVGPRGSDGETPVVSIDSNTYQLTVNGNKIGPSLKGQDGETPQIALSQEGKLTINGIPQEPALIGPRGPVGDAGVGVSNITFENSNLRFELTNGQNKEFPIDISKNKITYVDLDTEGSFGKDDSSAFQINTTSLNKRLVKIKNGKKGELITVIIPSDVTVEHNDKLVLTKNQNVNIANFGGTNGRMVFICSEGNGNGDSTWLEVCRSFNEYEHTHSQYALINHAHDNYALVNHKHNNYVDKNQDVTLEASLLVKGNITAQGEITAFSDMRLKTNVKKIDNPLEKLEKINGYYFTMNSKRQIGVIAQEVVQVLPEVVSDIYINNDSYLTVNYQNMIALLIETNKELLKRIEALEEKYGS